MAADSRFPPVVIWSPIVQGLINNMRHSHRVQSQNGGTSSPISIHPDLCKTVRSHATPADRDQTRAVLELMCGQTSDICNLANADAISCVMHVFFRALSSPERNRGLFVVWNSIRVLTGLCSDPSRENSYTAIAAKNHIGEVYFKQLVDMMGFSNGRNRQPAAETLLELIRKCPGQLTILASKTSRDLRVLGKMVLTDSDHLRAFIYGSIIREMAPYSMGFLFWPENASKEDIDRFPKTAILSSDWVEMFVRLRRRKKAPGREKIMLIGAVEIEKETWVTQCGIPVVMAFSEVNLATEGEIVLMTFQSGEVAYLRVPRRGIANVRVLQDDNKVELLLTEDRYYISRHDHKKKNVKTITLTPHSSATAEDVAEGVRIAVFHRSGLNNPPNPMPAGFPTYGSAVGALKLTSSNIFGATSGTSSGVPDNRLFGVYDGPCDDDYPFSSNPAAQKKFGLSRGYASAMIELHTSEQVEVENANYFEASQEPRTEVPDSQTQAANLTAPLGRAISDDSSASSEVIPETMSQQGHIEGGIRSEEMELDPEVAVDTNDDMGNNIPDTESAANAPSAECCVITKPKDQEELATPPKPQRDEEPKACNEGQADCHSEREGVDREAKIARPPNPDKSTRLRRPSRKILRPPPQKTGSVDWSQDIRVDPEEQHENIMSKLTKASKLTSEQLRDVKVSALKARSRGKKATTPNDKSRRQVLKTIASTRGQRAAAEKAKEKLALCVSSEDESVAYDPEDPIETSSGPESDTHVNPSNGPYLHDHDANSRENIGKEDVPDGIAMVGDGECEISSQKSNSVAIPERDVYSMDDPVVGHEANQSENIGEEIIGEKVATFYGNEDETDSNKSEFSDDNHQVPRITSPSIADSGIFVDKETAINEDDQDDQAEMNTLFRARNYHQVGKKAILSVDDQSVQNDVESSTTYAYSRSTPETISSSSEPETPCPKGRKRSRSVCEAPALGVAKKFPSMTWKQALRESQKTTLDILMDTSHRLVKSMVNEERAIEMVVLTYKNGLGRVKEQMIEAHEENLVYSRRTLEEIKTGMAGECREILTSLGDNLKEGLEPFREPVHEDNVLEEIAAAMEGYKRM